MSNLAAVAKKWHAARVKERALAAELYEAIRLAVNEGMSEVQAAKVAGVDRMTVRRALGKL
jgi:predicted DNA-binding protein (UPF0251 family)